MPAVVLAEVAASGTPVEFVEPSIAMFSVASFASAVFEVRMTSVVAPLTVYFDVIAATASSAVRILVATCDAVSPLITATFVAIGEPVMFAAVTVTITFALAVAAPPTVAVSTWDCESPDDEMRSPVMAVACVKVIRSTKVELSVLC